MWRRWASQLSWGWRGAEGERSVRGAGCRLQRRVSGRELWLLLLWLLLLPGKLAETLNARLRGVLGETRSELTRREKSSQPVCLSTPTPA